ncbi:MAG: hypothetical protein MJA28_12145 [Gammaproteobacteria bacterium]|nr:hypothetical protein [Gammaproteobacteria bacterium]
MNKTNTIGVDLAKNVFHLRIQDGDSAYFKYPSDIRRVTYTTNSIEAIQYFRFPILAYSS